MACPLVSWNISTLRHVSEVKAHFKIVDVFFAWHDPFLALIVCLGFPGFHLCQLLKFVDVMKSHSIWALLL